MSKLSPIEVLNLAADQVGVDKRTHGLTISILERLQSGALPKWLKTVSPVHFFARKAIADAYLAGAYAGAYVSIELAAETVHQVMKEQG